MRLDYIGLTFTRTFCREEKKKISLKNIPGSELPRGAAESGEHAAEAGEREDHRLRLRCRAGPQASQGSQRSKVTAHPVGNYIKGRLISQNMLLEIVW